MRDEIRYFINLEIDFVVYKCIGKIGYWTSPNHPGAWRRTWSRINLDYFLKSSMVQEITEKEVFLRLL